MANQASISVSLPEALVNRVREEIATNDTFDHVVSVALERELERRERFKAMLQHGQEWGRSVGIRSEDDVERIADGKIGLEDLKRPA